MSIEGEAAQAGTTPPLPRSIWLVAGASLATQVVSLLRHGGRVDDEVSLVGSVVLGGLLVGYVSAGVIRARTVRLVIAIAVLVLVVISAVIDLAATDDLGLGALDVLALALSGAALAGLVQFRRSDWYAWQRTKPPRHHGDSIRWLVLAAVLVGVLGGLVGPVEDGVAVRINVSGG